MSPVRQVQARLSPFWLAPRNRNPAIAESKRNNRPRGLGVLDKKNLGFVNYVGNRQYITLGNLAEIANAHTAISRGRRCHLSQLTLGKDVALPTSNYVAIALRVFFSQRRGSAKIIYIFHFRVKKMLTNE